MANKIAQIRNIALVGGADAGKTSLTDAFVFKSGGNTRLGKVDDGTSVSDFSEEEKKAKHSLSCSILQADFEGHHLNIVDTPGYPDFIGEAICGLYAVETAVTCINAYTGIVLNTRKMWERSGRLDRARVIVLTKLDLENIDWDKLIGSIREQFGDACTPVFMPVGTGGALEAVVNCFDGVGDAPDSAKEAAETTRSELIESLVEADEEVMERYLEGEEIDEDTLEKLMVRAIREGSFVPILCCSTEKDLGVEAVLHFLGRYAPSPADGPFFKARVGKGEDAEEIEIKPQDEGGFCGFVFRSVADPFIHQASFVRVVRGTFSAEPVQNMRTEKTEKITTILSPNGKEYKNIDSASAGEIVAIPKVESLQRSDTLAHSGFEGVFPEVSVPVPMVGRAVEPKSRNDEQKIGHSLKRLADEDPTFTVDRDAQTHELVVHGISNLHLDTIFERLKDRYKVEVVTHPPKIPYRETITGEAKSVYRHKKQTGGAGQFAEVHIRIEPLERGSGYEFSSEVFGGAISQQFQQSIDKGIRGLLPTGVIAGYSVVDVKVVVFDGKEHPVDSKDIAFQIAGRNAFKEAFKAAKPVLLEPIVKIEITVPSQFMGDISGDLNTRRGKIQGMDSIGAEQIIRALVPLSEVQTYSQDLRSITAGEGSYDMEFSHYDPVPSRIAQEVMSKFVAKDDDE